MIERVEGITINQDESGQIANTKLDRKSIFTNKTNEIRGEVLLTFPAIKIGSIIDYKYQSVMRNYNGLDDWDFQDRLPVVASKYTLVIVPNAEFAYRVNTTMEKPAIVKKLEYRGGIYFEMNNIPGLGNEPYMDARRDYLQKVIFQLSGYNNGGPFKSKYMTSWDEVGRELMTSPEFGAQLTKNIPGTSAFIAAVKLLPTAEDRMKAVFNYVRSNMRWNNIYSRYSIIGVKEAWQKQSGNRGDINLALINLLKDAGLNVNPVLVSERFHGKVDAAYPFIDQFNAVFACVDINNKKYYLDATDMTTPPHITPMDILNTTGYIVNRKTGGLVKIMNDSLQYSESILGHLTITPEGAIEGGVEVYSKDYARIEKLKDYRADKKKFVSEYFEVEGTTVGAKDVEVSDVESDSMAFKQVANVSGSLSNTGEYSFLPLNIFTGYDHNPFLSDNRFSNINFGYRRFLNMNITFHLPANYSVDELPKSVRMVTPDKDISFLRQIEYDKKSNEIRFMMQIKFTESLYENDTYPILKEVYKKIFDYLKEPVVLKKKTPGN